MKFLTVVLVIATFPAHAQDWQKLNGPQIEAALDDRRVQYQSGWQEFYESGKTLYNAGRDSWGYWRVQGDQYCSQWPPNAGWDCYNFYRSKDGLQVRFESGQGHLTDAVYGELK